MNAFLQSTTLLFVLLNPFLMTIYLLDLIERLDGATFRSVLVRGSAISACVFAVFALAGAAIFQDVLQVRFASFLVFGGIVFLIIGIRFVFDGPEAVTRVRGPAEHLAGSIAMPFMIGPATVSASVLAGAHLSAPLAVLSIVAALAAAVAGILLLKTLYDHVHQRNERLVSRYIDIVGRISALVVGTIAMDMILSGLEMWLTALKAGA